MHLPGHPYVTAPRLLAAALIGFVLFWSVGVYRTWWLEQQPFDYGAPTRLADEQPMRHAVCQIRSDLDALPQRLVKRHYYHEAWTEYRFAAGRFEYRPAHQITLTESAQDFVRRHSRTELIAALSPLLLDAVAGGRAAAILAGLPARSKRALANTSLIAGLVKEAQGNDPAAPIVWTVPDMSRFYEPPIPRSLYGLVNMGKRLERSVPRNLAGSFEARLETLLEARSKLPMEVISLPQQKETYGARQSVEQLLNSGIAPVADPAFLKYLASFPRQDILIAVFPMLGNQGQGSGGPLVEMIWANSVQDRYWPLVIGNPLIEGEPYLPLRAEIVTELIGLCDD